MCTGAYIGRGVSRLMCTYALTGNTIFMFLSQGVLSLPSLKSGCFCIYSNLHKKQAFSFFLNNFWHKYLFTIPLWRKIDNASSYFIVSSKNLKWKLHFHSDTFWHCLILIWLFGVAKYQGGEEGKPRGTDEESLSVKPLLIWYGETYSAGQ